MKTEHAENPKETAHVLYEQFREAFPFGFPRNSNGGALGPWEVQSEHLKGAWRVMAAAVVLHDRIHDSSFGTQQPEWAKRLEVQQKSILEAIMSTATRADLDAGIAQLLEAEATRDAAVTTALNDLIAKVNSGTVAPEDFSAELAQIATLQANAAALTQTATTDDPGSTVVPPTPLVGTTGEALTADKANSTDDGEVAEGDAAADAAKGILEGGTAANTGDEVAAVKQEPQTE